MTAHRRRQDDNCHAVAALHESCQNAPALPSSCFAPKRSKTDAADLEHGPTSQAQTKQEGTSSPVQVTLHALRRSLPHPYRSKSAVINIYLLTFQCCYNLQ